MQNIDVKVTGTKPVPEIDMSKTLGPSKSGKTVLIATTNGNIPVPGSEDVRFGVTIYKYPDR